MGRKLFREIIIPTLAGLIGLHCVAHAEVIGDPDVEVDGRLGVGISTPGYPVHIYNTRVNKFISDLSIENPVDPFAGSTRFQVSNPVSGIFFQAFGSNSSGVLAGAAGLTSVGNKLLIGAGAGAPVMIYANSQFASGTGHLYIATNGNVGLGTANPTSKLDVSGNLKAVHADFSGDVGLLGDVNVVSGNVNVAGETVTGVLEITGGSDLSESFNVAGAEIEAGMVVSIDPENPGALRVASKAYDRTVAGIVSGANGVRTGMLMGQKGTLAHGDHPVALTGRVWCLVDATEHGVLPGDLMTTSNTPGHAMKAADYARSQGAILGKAMTSLNKGEKGLVLLLVSLQ